LLVVVLVVKPLVALVIGLVCGHSLRTVGQGSKVASRGELTVASTTARASAPGRSLRPLFPIRNRGRGCQRGLAS